MLVLLAPAPEARADRLDDLERMVKGLGAEVKTLRRDLARERQERQREKMEHALQLESVEQREQETQGAVRNLKSLVDGGGKVKLGGYGSVRYENGNAKTPSTFTFRRFVLTTDAEITDRLSVYSEIEYERFSELELEKEAFKIREQDASGRVTQGLGFKQEVEGTDGSEIAIEQAWAKYKIFGEKLALQAGGVLVPVGRFNLNHDDNLYEIPRRPLAVRGAPALPVNAAWTDLGVGVLGTLTFKDSQKLSYWAYVLNGVELTPTIEEEVLFREGTPNGRRDVTELEVELAPAGATFNQDGNNDKAYAGRIAYSPTLNSEIGFSAYSGRYTTLTSAVDERIHSYAIDGRFRKGPFEVVAEGIYTDFGNTGQVLQGLARRIGNGESESGDPALESEIEIAPRNFADRRMGYYVDLKYHFWPKALSNTFLGKGLENPELVLVGRAESVHYKDFVTGVAIEDGRASIDREDRGQDRYTLALGYRPTPDWVFSLAWEYSRLARGSALLYPDRLPERSTSTFLSGLSFAF
jgi:hypothetical protein